MTRATEINLIYFVKGALAHPKYTELLDIQGEGELDLMEYLADRAAELQEVLNLFVNVEAPGCEAYELVEADAIDEFFGWYFSDRSLSLTDRFILIASDWYEFDIRSSLAQSVAEKTLNLKPEFAELFPDFY